MHTLVHNFSILGRVNRDKYCDIKLLTECGSVITAHKVILGCVSKKLSQSFDKYPEQSEIKVRNVKIYILKKVIDFVYSGKVHLANQMELSDFADAFTILNMYVGQKFSSVIKNINSVTADSSEKSSQEVIYTCEVCEKSYDTQKQLCRHKRDKHLDKKQTVMYKCEKCGKQSINQRVVQYCPCKTRKRKRSKKFEKENVCIL